MLLYLDRFATTPLSDTMMRELTLTKTQLGDAVGAFFLAYAFMQIPTGWLTDAFGARFMLALYVLGWSLATIGVGLAQDLMTIWWMRLFLGIAQAGAYPTAAGLLKRWIPYSSRGLANTSVGMGGRAGLVLSTAITVPMMFGVQNITHWSTGNWRVVFFIYGALGVVWALLFVWLYRDTPKEHPWCNAAEVKLTADSSAETGRSFGLPVIPMLLSKEVWIMCFISFSVNVGWIFLATWLPQYLIDHHRAYVTEHIGNVEVFAGFITAGTVLAAICGGILGGRTTDVMVRRAGHVWGRRLPGIISGVLACGLYLLVPQISALWPFVVVIILTAFVIDFGLGATWACYQDIGGRNVASILGFGNMCGNLGAFYFGKRIGVLADNDRWPDVFLIAAAAMLLVACGWRLFDASRPVVRGTRESRVSLPR